MKPSTVFKSAALTFAMLTAAAAQASCYTVVGPKGQVLSESPNPPVDLSYQLHQTITYKYGPGARLIFGIDDPDCGDWIDIYTELENRNYAAKAGGKQSRRRARRDRE
ncbi:hypothetical protein [Ottowia sp.]|uniref:hypothetical protein n=1 Tax=Ottowia sp. TaxID=1898956 RepID=UPI003A8BE47F